MFQCLLAFLNEVVPFSIASITSSNASLIHFPLVIKRLHLFIYFCFLIGPIQKTVGHFPRFGLVGLAIHFALCKAHWSSWFKPLWSQPPTCWVSQPYFGQVWGETQHLEKVRIWSPPGLPNVQSSTARPKTPRIEVFLVSLERSWSVDIENGLALAIWTSVAQVMGKRRAGSQTGSLTPDH
jgi:hypothetical protein